MRRKFLSFLKQKHRTTNNWKRSGLGWGVGTLICEQFLCHQNVIRLNAEIIRHYEKKTFLIASTEGNFLTFRLCQRLGT